MRRGFFCAFPVIRHCRRFRNFEFVSSFLFNILEAHSYRNRGDRPNVRSACASHSVRTFVLLARITGRCRQESEKPAELRAVLRIRLGSIVCLRFLSAFFGQCRHFAGCEERSYFRQTRASVKKPPGTHFAPCPHCTSVVQMQLRVRAQSAVLGRLLAPLDS